MLTEESMESENNEIVRDLAIVAAAFAAIYAIPKVGLKLLERHRTRQVETYSQFTAHKDRYGRVYIDSEKS